MAKPQYKRSARVSDQMHHEIADILMRKIKDPRVGFVTVTAVELSDDLRNAKVFISVYGGNKDETLKGLASATPVIRAEIGRRMRIKFAPELLFRIDETAERGAHIQGLLRELEREKEEGDGGDE